jgi:hypothetical protein
VFDGFVKAFLYQFELKIAESTVDNKNARIWIPRYGLLQAQVSRQ